MKEEGDEKLSAQTQKQTQGVRCVRGTDRWDGQNEHINVAGEHAVALRVGVFGFDECFQLVVLDVDRQTLTLRLLQTTQPNHKEEDE
jgi:hypothetical protein